MKKPESPRWPIESSSFLLAVCLLTSVLFAETYQAPGWAEKPSRVTCAQHGMTDMRVNNALLCADGHGQLYFYQDVQ